MKKKSNDPYNSQMSNREKILERIGEMRENIEGAIIKGRLSAWSVGSVKMYTEALIYLNMLEETYKKFPVRSPITSDEVGKSL